MPRSAEEIVDGLVVLLPGDPPRSLAVNVGRVKVVVEIARLVQEGADMLHHILLVDLLCSEGCRAFLLASREGRRRDGPLEVLAVPATMRKVIQALGSG